MVRFNTKQSTLKRRLILVELLVIGLQAVHLLCMHVASAGPLVCTWLAWREWRRGDGVAGRIGRYLANSSVTLLLVGVAAGFLVGWILAVFSARQYGVVLERLPTKIWWGGWEIAFSAATLALYAFWWRIAPPRNRATYGLHTFMAVLAGTNLMYHFPPLFAIASQLAAGGNATGNVIDAAEFRRLMLQGAVMSKTIHFWGASFVVTGIWVMACASRGSDAGDDASSERPVVRWGARLALLATLAQLPVGVWVLLELPTLTQQQLMGQDWLGAAMLAGSIIVAIALLHHLAAAAFGQSSRKSVVWSLVLMLAVVVLMAGTLHRIRDYGVDGVGVTLPGAQIDFE